MKVIKRRGQEQEFCLDKIYKAIRKANNNKDLVPEEGRMTESEIEKVINGYQGIMKKLEGFNSVNVDDIHLFIEKTLYAKGFESVARSYVVGREQKQLKKKYTENEEQAIALISGDSELRGDNANKSIDTNPAISDYLAGIITKSIGKKQMPKVISKAHSEGLMHFHDSDYSPLRPMHNCFSGEQKFLSDKGLCKFSDFIDGDVVFVKDKDGITRQATVHKFGMQALQEVIISNGKRIDYRILCTPNHRWILIDGTVTESLKVGDKLYLSNSQNNSETIDNIDDAKIWCLGFIIGDGVDHKASNGVDYYTQVRLCGSKNKYIENFRKAGFRIKSLQNGDMCPYTKKFSKQAFLDAKCWRYLSAHQKGLLFDGLYCADGRVDGSSIQVSDSRVIELIEECSGMNNYHITSKTEGYHDTNYKNNAYYCIIRFLRPQLNSTCWKVKSIKSYKNSSPKNVYCVTEPITHTFTLEKGIVTGNCDLTDTEDMLEHTFVMGSTLIKPNEETPFRVAANLLAQGNLQISSVQYGGQTQSWAHLLKYIDLTRKVLYNDIKDDFAEEGIVLTEDRLNSKVERKLQKEIYEGVKTYQYQVLCHCSSNGQTPFVANNICLREAESEQELKDMAILIEEILKRRKKGVQDVSGIYVSPLFPKLLYWTCEGLNLNPEDPYYYLTELAAECAAIRMQPDIMSEKQGRIIKKGQMIPVMGCRSCLSPIWEMNEYSIDKEFYYVANVENGEYPYGTFVDKKSFANIPNGDYRYPTERNYTYENKYGEFADFAINFRGNTGWLVSKSDDKVIILQPKIYGRYNLGVVTVNTPHAALSAVEYTKENGGDLLENFYKIFDERLELCHKALKFRADACKKIKGKNSPILWMYGALGRIGAEDTLEDFIADYPSRHSISLGYVGLFETCQALINESNTTARGQKLCKEILQHMNNKCDEWKVADKMIKNGKEYTYNYSIYGTPEESLTYKFAMALRRDFGLIDKITDKDYVVNSYHVDPREEIDAFKKLEIEGQYLALSSGGAVSYVETHDLIKNPKAIVTLIQYIHEHIMYAEINRKIGVCKKCGYVGDIPLSKTENGEFVFTCPSCGNHDDSEMDVTCRICGYLGKVNAGNTNKGRLDDIYHRVIHTDCCDELDIINKN